MSETRKKLINEVAALLWKLDWGKDEWDRNYPPDESAGRRNTLVKAEAVTNHVLAAAVAGVKRRPNPSPGTDKERDTDA